MSYNTNITKPLLVGLTKLQKIQVKLLAREQKISQAALIRLAVEAYIKSLNDQ